MAQRPLTEDTVGDLTRESLIAISDTLPETDPASPTVSSKKTPEVDNNITDIKEDTTMEDCRSELISLSYTAPDEPLPEPKVDGNMEEDTLPVDYYSSCVRSQRAQFESLAKALSSDG